MRTSFARPTLIAILVANALLSGSALASNDENDTQKINDLKQQLTDITEQLDELNSRVDKTERHTSLDRLEITGDFRTKAHSLHYRDVVWNPAIKVNFNDFGAKAMSGAFGMPNDPNSPLGQMMQANPDLANAFQSGQLQGVMPYVLAPKTVQDIDNDIYYTTRLRLNLKAKVWDNVSFAGRLTMFKNWGDSTGVQVFDSWRSFTMDGTSSGNTSGDWLRVERAYFDWKNINGSEFYLSIGRRPSTYGPPSHYRENELRGGTPSGHLVNFNFDGATLGYNLGEITGVDGQVVRFCYGQGFESQWGNGEMFGDIVTKDTHLGGFNIDAINDGNHFLQFTLFGAKDINDGFKGTMAFPTQLAGIFAPTMYQDMQKFDNFNFVTRVQPSGVIGDMYLGGVGYAYESDDDMKLFASLGWTRAESNGNAGMFGGMLSDAVFEAELNSTGTEIIMVPKTSDDDSSKDGYGIYVGMQIPAPYGKFGLEYNYGSKYWTPFTQAQDDPIGSKLATRGHVAEAYYIFDINPKMFIKLAGLYYDFEYTGSGTPVGAPQNIDDVIAGTSFSMLPVVDTAYDVNASLTINF